VNLLNPLFFRALNALGAHHDRRTMSVVGTYINALIATQFLKPYPDICLDVFHEMANMNGAICVGQGGSYEYTTGCSHVGANRETDLLPRHCIEERQFAKPQ